MKLSALKLTSIVLVLSILCLTCKKNDRTRSDEQNPLTSEISQVKTLILKKRGYESFPDVSHYRNLEFLDLSNNSISEIPKQVTKLKKLKKLYLSENNIKVIPSYIAELDSLSILYLLYNKVETISADICSMDNLRVLNLNGNPNSNIPNCLKNTSKIIVYLETNM